MHLVCRLGKYQSVSLPLSRFSKVADRIKILVGEEASMEGRQQERTFKRIRATESYTTTT